MHGWFANLELRALAEIKVTFWGWYLTYYWDTRMSEGCRKRIIWYIISDRPSSMPCALMPRISLWVCFKETKRNRHAIVERSLELSRSSQRSLAPATKVHQNPWQWRSSTLSSFIMPYVEYCIGQDLRSAEVLFGELEVGLVWCINQLSTPLKCNFIMCPTLLLGKCVHRQLLTTQVASSIKVKGC